MSDEAGLVNQPDLAARGVAGPYVRALTKHRWVVLLVALATIAGTAAYLAVRTPQYDANVDVLFTPLQQGDRSSQGLPLVVSSSDPTRDVQTGATLLNAPQAAALAASRLGTGWTGSKVASATTVQPSGQSNILVITAHAGSPAEAARVATAFATAALDSRRAILRQQALAVSPSVPLHPASGDTVNQPQRAEINLLLGGDDPNFAIVHAATGNKTSTAPSAKLVLLFAGLGGLALGVVAAILLELFSNRVRDSDELRELYPAPVLAYLPQLPRRRGGAAPPIGMSADGMAAAQLLAAQLQTHDSVPRQGSNAGSSRGDPARVLLITAASAGDGATTTTLQLAEALATFGRTVLVIDCDLRSADVTRGLELQGQSGVADILSNGATVSDCVISSPLLPEVTVLPAGTGESSDMLLGARLPQILRQAHPLADYVLIDGRPLPDASELLPALSAVDEVLLVGRPGRTRRAAFKALRALLDNAAAPSVSLVVIGDGGRRVRSDGRSRVASVRTRSGSTARIASTTSLPEMSSAKIRRRGA